jgi:rhodanese-related sulfurtransferase
MLAQTTPVDASAILESEPQAIYLDVRTVAEYEAGHPVGAYNVPLMVFDPATQQPRPNPEFERVVQAVLPRQTKILVGCQVGGRSQRAAEIMDRLGFVDLANVQGGFGGGRDASGRAIPGWKDSGLPVETGNPPDRSYEALQRKV